jgi:hypothetical protein
MTTFEEQFPSLVGRRIHIDVCGDELYVPNGDYLSYTSIEECCLDKQRVREAVGELTRLRGITVECQIHNSITTDRERILKELGL